MLFWGGKKNNNFWARQRGKKDSSQVMVVPRKSVLIPIIHLVLVLFFTVRVFVPRRDRNVSPQTVGACSDWRGPIDWSRYSVNGMGSNAALGKITIRWVRWERKRICGTHLFFYFCRVSNYFLLGVSSFFFPIFHFRMYSIFLVVLLCILFLVTRSCGGRWHRTLWTRWEAYNTCNEEGVW